MSVKNCVPMAAVMLLLAACSQSGPGPVALATPLATPLSQPRSPSATATATRTPRTTVTVTPGQQRVLDANASVSTALFGISAASARVKASSALSVPRKAVADSLGTARARLSAERTAAFGSVRNCTAVLSFAAQVRSAAAGVSAGRGRVGQVTASMRAQVNGLTQAVAVVAARLKSLQGTLAAEAHPPAVVSVSEVQTAMASARTFAATTLAAAASADASASAAVSKASSLSGQAGTLAAKTC